MILAFQNEALLDNQAGRTRDRHSSVAEEQRSKKQASNSPTPRAYSEISQSAARRTGANKEREIGMTGRARLPGGEPRKASQRNARRAAQRPAQIARVWKSGDAVHWKGRSGSFHRDVGDGEHAEIAIAERIYRVLLSELGRTARWPNLLSRAWLTGCALRRKRSKRSSSVPKPPNEPGSDRAAGGAAGGRRGSEYSNGHAKGRRAGP